MSIIGAHLTEHRGLVLVDSLGAETVGECFTTSKCFPLVHQNALIAGRGSAQQLTSTAMLAASTTLDFDGLADALLGLARQVHQWPHPAGLPQASIDALQRARDGAQDLIMVGYSPTRGRIVGWWYSCAAGSKEWRKEELQEFFLAPDVPDAYPETEAELIETARRQVRLEPIAGGALRLAAVTKDEIRVRVAAELGVPGELLRVEA